MATTNKLPDGSTWEQFVLSNVTENQSVTVTFSPDLNDDGIPDKYQTVTVQAQSDGDGTVSPEKNEIALGGNITFTVSPGAGQALYQIKDGDSVIYTNNDVQNIFSGQYTLSNVMVDTILTFVFSTDTDGDGIPDVAETWYTITMSHDDNTNISSTAIPGTVEGTVRVKAGNSATFLISANNGYAVKTITIDDATYENRGMPDSPITDWNSYIFSGVSGDHTISVTGGITTGSTPEDLTVPDEYKYVVTPIMQWNDDRPSTQLDPILVIYGHDAIIVPTMEPEYAVDTITTITTTYINDPNFGAAQIDGVGYETVQEAISAANDGEVINLNADVTTPISVSGSKQISLNLSGHSISSDSASAIVVEDGSKLILGVPTDTLSNTATDSGAVTCSYADGYAVEVKDGGTAVIYSGTYTSTNGIAVNCGSFSAATKETTPGTLTIYGGEFHAQEFAVRTYGQGSHVTIYDGEFSANDNAVVANNGSVGAGGTTIEIHGGIFTGNTESAGYIGCGVYHPGYGTLEIDGGTFNVTNGLGVLVRSGNASITDAEFNISGTISGKVGDSSVINSCYGIMLDGKANYPQLEGSTVNVGGNIVMNVESDCIAATYTQGVTSTLLVSSGTFSNKIASEYVVDYAICIPGPDGKYLVVNKDSVDPVIGDGVGYSTLSAAIAANATDLFVTQDIQGANIPAGKITNIQGNGHKLIGTVVLESGDDNQHGQFTANNLIFEGSGTYSWAIQNQRQTADAGKSTYAVEASGCTFQNYTKKGIYCTELDSLTLNNCSFSNCATDPMNTPNTYGDYVVDLNLMGVEDVAVAITGCTFTDNGAKKATVKVAARGGESDADATDVPAGISTSVASMAISQCSFQDAECPAAVAIGTNNKSESTNPDASNTTGDFGQVTISDNSTSVIVSTPYDGETYTVLVGQTFTKSGNGAPVIS